jgi:hypothetical protein
MAPSALPAEFGIALDITHGIGRTGFYAAYLAGYQRGTVAWSGNVFAPEFDSAAVIRVVPDPVDQPYAVLKSDTIAADELYIGFQQIDSAGSRARLDVYSGTRMSKAGNLSRRNRLLDHVPVRVAVGSDSTAYAVFFEIERMSAAEHLADLVVVRDDKLGLGPGAFFADLIEPSDRTPGRIVAESVTVKWCPDGYRGCMGKERIGSALAIAANPAERGGVFVAWGAADSEESQSIYVAMSIDRGETWALKRVIPRSTNPALAVAENGVVGLFYQKYSPGCWKQPMQLSCWETILEQTADNFDTEPRKWVLSVSPEPAGDVSPPIWGDYGSLTYTAGSFRGVFFRAEHSSR